MKEHLSPPQPDNYPPIVYKHRDWKNDFHKRTLLNHELFLSSPGNFNDPFDCKIPIAHWKLAEDVKLEVAYFTEVVKRQYPNYTQSQQLKEFERIIKEKRYADPEWVKNEEIDFYNSISKNFGVISLTEFKDNIQMWSHYSNSHTGFCIGFKSEKLFFGQDFHFGQGGKVNYKEKFPIILPTEDPMSQFTTILYTKFKTWEYEQEYRLTKIHAANQTVSFLPEEVEEIIVGRSTSNSDTQSILNICKCNFPDIPVFKAKEERLNFKLKFERLI